MNCNLADFHFKVIMKKLLEKKHSTEGNDVRTRYEDGTAAHSYFMTHITMRYNLEEGQFPLLALRPIAWKNAIKEILWIYQDQSNDLELLKDKYGITWWDSWDIGNRTIGQRYGATVKKYSLIDNLINGLKTQPYTRRHIMDLYQYSDFEETEGLHPCAFMTMWSVSDNKLDMTLIQRSSDFIVAGSINQIQYVALQLMIAKAVGLEVGKFTHYIENLHLYDRHIEQAKEMIERFSSVSRPKLILNTDKTDFYNFNIDDFEVVDYRPIKPQLKFELAL